jgi:hypothetical protein
VAPAIDAPCWIIALASKVLPVLGTTSFVLLSARPSDTDPGMRTQAPLPL